MTQERNLPLSTVTLVFGAASIPLAFVRQLCVPAVIMAVLAVLFHLWGKRRQRTASFTPASIKRSRQGFLMAIPGGACALMMWVLWATGALL